MKELSQYATLRGMVHEYAAAAPPTTPAPPRNSGSFDLKPVPMSEPVEPEHKTEQTIEPEYQGEQTKNEPNAETKKLESGEEPSPEEVCYPAW